MHLTSQELGLPLSTEQIVLYLNIQSAIPDADFN